MLHKCPDCKKYSCIEVVHGQYYCKNTDNKKCRRVFSAREVRQAEKVQKAGA